MKKYIYIFSIAAFSLMSACSLDREPLSDQSELNLGSSNPDDSVRIKFKDRAALLADMRKPRFARGAQVRHNRHECRDALV